MKELQKYIFNPETLLYEEKGEHRWRRLLRMGIFAVLAFSLAVFYFWFYTSVLKLDLPKTAFLKNQNARWSARMEIVNHDMDVHRQTLLQLVDRNDNVYRSIFGLDAVSSDLRNSGLGGDNRYEAIDQGGGNAELRKTQERLDFMTKRLYVQSNSLDEVASVARTAGDMVSCIPAVPPVCPDVRVRLSSPFGYRSDPMSGRTTMHQGQDFGCDRGTPVYATGNGVVEVCGVHFKGYGNEIIIDHGFGYKSHYAHLHTIEIAKGMKVRRGQRIGTVGSTGKSTAPHLHYEVFYKGAKVNPARFFDFQMSKDEYRAMISERNEDLSKRPTTNQILERRKR